MSNDITVRKEVLIEDNQTVSVSIFQDGAAILKVCANESGLSLTCHLNTKDLVQINMMIENTLIDNRKLTRRKFD